MHSYRFAVQHSSKLFEVSSDCLTHFLTRITRELLTFRNTAALLVFLAALRIRCSSSSLVHLVWIQHSFHVTPHMVIYLVQIRWPWWPILCTATTNPQIMEFIIQILPYKKLPFMGSWYSLWNCRKQIPTSLRRLWHPPFEHPTNIWFVFGAAAPSGPWLPHSRGFWITDNNAPQSVGLLWMTDQFVAETSTWQHTTLKTNIHAPGGIRTHNLNRRAAVDLRLRSRGYRDWH